VRERRNEIPAFELINGYISLHMHGLPKLCLEGPFVAVSQDGLSSLNLEAEDQAARICGSVIFAIFTSSVSQLFKMMLD
jgi:hypothetical protein